DLQSKLRQNSRYLKQIGTFLNSMSAISKFCKEVNDAAIARGLPEARMLVSRRLASQVLKWSGLIKDAQAVISNRLFDARLLERRQKLLSGVSLWLGRHKTTQGWDLDILPDQAHVPEMLRATCFTLRVQPDVADADELINTDLLRVVDLLPRPKVIPEAQPPSEAQRLIEDDDEDELTQEDAPSHVRAILALAQVMRGTSAKVSLLQWKQERLDMRLLDDSAWLMYCYPRLRELGMEAEFVVPVAGDIFGVNELFDDILVSSTTQETTA
ncbi:hypothetical protein ACWOQQ_23480, partial [Enterobacter sp. ESY66]